MVDLLKMYEGIVSHFGEKWLNNPANQTHPLFGILHEINYLKDYDMYLKEIPTEKSITRQLHNKPQFWDIYYEVEINYYLKQSGLRPQFHKKINGQETDISLEEQKVVLEITHLDIPDKVIKNLPRIDPKDKTRNEGKIHDILPSEHSKRMKRYLDGKKFQEVYPNIVIFCTHLVSGGCSDLANLVHEKNYDIPKQVCALAIWGIHKKIDCLFENPQGKQFEWTSNELKRFFDYQSRTSV